MPIFVLGFILFYFGSALGIFSDAAIHFFGYFSDILFIVSMAAIGLKINIHDTINIGRSAFLVAGMVFFFQIILTCIFMLFGANLFNLSTVL